MTNTRITDPEILERRYPLLLQGIFRPRRLRWRGQAPGGDGLVREVEFLEPLNMAILSERRVFAPYGLEGGGRASGGRTSLSTATAGS
jgi:5-oxoprolinase (ATP-hydrolysing)